jgi:putative ABC transport system ATP-binding protein
VVSPIVIDVQNLEFAWDNANAFMRVPEFQVRTGEKILIVGESGVGKSSLLMLLSGMAIPQRGKLEVFGINVSGLSASERDLWRARSIALIFQSFNLIPYLSVIENVQLGCVWSGTVFDVQRAEYLLSQLGLEASLFHKRAMNLSVGQQQRVAIARALISDAKLILADEISSALDEKSKLQLIEFLFKEIRLGEKTLLWVSHQELKCRFDRIIDMRDWRTEE